MSDLDLDRNAINQLIANKRSNLRSIQTNINRINGQLKRMALNDSQLRQLETQRDAQLRDLQALRHEYRLLEDIEANDCKVVLKAIPEETPLVPHMRVANNDHNNDHNPNNYTILKDLNSNRVNPNKPSIISFSELLVFAFICYLSLIYFAKVCE